MNELLSQLNSLDKEIEKYQLHVNEMLPFEMFYFSHLLWFKGKMDCCADSLNESDFWLKRSCEFDQLRINERPHDQLKVEMQLRLIKLKKEMTEN